MTLTTFFAGLLPLLSWALLLAELALALPIGYLTVVTAAALLTRLPSQATASAPPSSTTEPLRFVVLIPAHNEESVIETLLASLQQLAYPRSHYQVYVIADNCTDDTASLVRSTGWASVYERCDLQRRGKGYALNWALTRLAEDGVSYDACVFLDADAVVEPSFLQALEQALRAGLARGEDLQALQARNTVLNASASPGTALRWLALSLMNHVRPLGRTRLGASSTLTGNGMCLTRALLERYPWEAFSRGEDYEYYLHLVEQGIYVRYVPEAIVRSQMPLRFAQMRSQDLRWEAAEANTSALKRASRLLRAGLQAGDWRRSDWRRGDWRRLEAVAELLTPPLSVLLAGTTLVLLASLLLRWPPAMVLALLLLLGLSVYVLSPLALLDPPKGIYRAFFFAPVFVLWKLWVYLVLRQSQRQQRDWLRTDRTPA
ncbi:glycosyltransferase family 2 protein [Thermogemmatispora onikobensis]|uniref:glycosyltransferase family 2 protein n=1 Tax=Thermogemmatispora onikobensis TaxID=732234 RepID=UPI000853E567|nr:glycosyltransferase family 2 protein [Thermogemmatispora onikobensis]